MFEIVSGKKLSQAEASPPGALGWPGRREAGHAARKRAKKKPWGPQSRAGRPLTSPWSLTLDTFPRAAQSKALGTGTVCCNLRALRSRREGPGRLSAGAARRLPSNEARISSLRRGCKQGEPVAGRQLPGLYVLKSTGVQDRKQLRSLGNPG